MAHRSLLPLAWLIQPLRGSGSGGAWMYRSLLLFRHLLDALIGEQGAE